VIFVNQLFIGIDVGSRDNTVFIMLPDGSKHSSFSVQNNLGGAQTLSKRVIAALEKLKLNDVVIGIEATSVYGDNLIYFLREDGALAKFNRKIHVLNPKQVKKFKDAYPDLPKTDDVDAFIVADNLRFGRITAAVYMDDYRYQALKNLTRARFFAVQSLIREKQRFLNYLFMKCSGLAVEKTFSDKFGATALSLFEDFESAEQLASMDLNELAAFICEKGKNRFANPEDVATTVQAAARGSYRLPKTINDSVSQIMAISISSIRAISSQIKALEKEIEKQFSNIPNTLISIKGIGLVYSAGIIAEVGDIKRFKGEASVAKYAGLAWHRHQSGTFEGQHTRLIKSGNRFLKYYLCEAAFSLVRCDTEFKRFYDLKYKEVNKSQHKRALALTARKLVRLVFRLLKDNRLYIPKPA
jgi:transposase